MEKKVKDNRISKISNVFIEIIILIVFFAVAAVIIFKIHAVTIINNCENMVKDNAIINSNSIISLYKSGLDVEESIEKVFNKTNIATVDVGKLVINMDTDFIINKDGNVHLLVSNKEVLSNRGKLSSIVLEYLYNDTIIYSIEGKRYEEE